MCRTQEEGVQRIRPFSRIFIENLIAVTSFPAAAGVLKFARSTDVPFFPSLATLTKYWKPSSKVVSR